jgi:hypothetical protein
VYLLPRPGEPAAGRLVRIRSPGGSAFRQSTVHGSLHSHGKVANGGSDDGAELALRGGKKCLFDTRDDVQERDYPGNLEDPFGDRHTPQHDSELATEFNGVFLRL